MKKIPNKLQVWVDARQKYRLSDAQIQMARELGMNPRHFGKLANHRQETWKVPLPQFIESLYFKRFGKIVPDKIVSIEDSIDELERKKEPRRERKHQSQESLPAPVSEEPS